MSKEIAEEYASSLADLTVNSKPLINMLTILAEENIDHAGVIVETVEKHLEKVHPDIKLPVLYLVDSIIKNVGGAYMQKFSESIVNMFTRTFKQVDEKVRSQMFKLRETWHDVFPAKKLYQLDVKVNLIDPAWPIQAQPPQSNIHVNPNFLKKNTPTTSAAPVLTEEEDKMRSLVAKKEQELLMLQRKKIEMELEQTKRQLELAEKNAKKMTSTILPNNPPLMPVAMVNPVVTVTVPVEPAPPLNIPVKQRLGPPVNKVGGRIAPVSGALASARRDPRLARHAGGGAPAPSPAPTLAPAPAPAAPPPQPAPLLPIAPNVFDIKPLERVTKRKNVITIDVRQEQLERRDPRRRDPRLNKRERPRAPAPALNLDSVPDSKAISKLPPIPKIRRDPEPDEPAAPKKKKEVRDDKKKKRETNSAGSSPEKKNRKEKESPKEQREKRRRERRPAEPAPEPEVAFKELKNFNKERFMRRNRAASDSPERRAPPAPPATNMPEVVENKDVDLRVLPVVTENQPAPITQKRSSTELLDPTSKPKKSKLDKFDVLFGNEDVDLRQLPQVDEITAPPPPSLTESPKSGPRSPVLEVENKPSPQGSPKKDWNEVKEKADEKKTPSKLDLVRAKLAEATKGKDRLGRPLLFSKSPSVEKERRRTLSTEDTDLRVENADEYDPEDHKKSISIIVSQAKEQFTDGQLDKNQYNTLMYQVLQLNEKLKLKEAKQRESLEVSKRKLKAHIEEENHKVPSPKSSPNTFGDIDERITPAVYADTPPDSQNFMGQDSDMRMNSMPLLDAIDGHKPSLLPLPPVMPMFGPFPPNWRGPRPRTDEFGPRRFRGPVPPYFRGKYDKRGVPWPQFEPRPPPMPHLPTPKIGTCQGECPLLPYERTSSPPPLGLNNVVLPLTNFKILEYIDQDPFKSIQIDGISRDIRFYGDTAIIMMDWDDPREIKFLPGCRRVTFDNKDSIVLSFNEGYKQVEIDDQVFDIKFGAPTRELYINGRWYECFFGGQALGVVIDGKPRLVHLEGPLPQVDIGKEKRTDLVAGKVNLIVDAVHMYPMFLDAKVQKFQVNGQYITLRFVDSFKTVLINERPFKVEFGGLPKPVIIGNDKYFIRFSALPRHVKPGQTKIANMEGLTPTSITEPVVSFENIHDQNVMEPGFEKLPRPVTTPSPDPDPEPISDKGLDMLASVMPSSMEMAPASNSEYSSTEPLFSKPDKIPGLDTTPVDEKPITPVIPMLGNLNVNDLFAKLVATGIVQVPKEPKVETKEEIKPDEVKQKPKEDKNLIHRVDFMKPETLRVKQAGLVGRLYGGMQCSGCGARFPPEHTVRYSQHLDWHFRQNRRDRDSARRAHSRHWHYDLSDWLQYEEVEDLDERGEHTVRYSQHLDWHFRQNRRDRDSARRAHSRHWHYDLSDWLQYEEVEDLDERGEHTVRYSQHLDWHFRQNRRDRDSARRAHSRHWHYDLSDWLQYEEVEDLDERGEHTVRYSQHLDWHFRQNRRDRDSARRAHSRHWHYDLSDWLQYEEVEDLDERGEHTVRYSQHLDWHFRQNRRDRDSARRAHSRHWHYDLSDWLQYEEVEDLDERGEHTVRYSQHLDWHFRQNRRDRDSARRAHSRHWHYDLSDWLQYEEVEDLDERGEHTVRYSQHLDWHFRQNRRDRDSARRAHSRHWHYDLSDWLQYEEVEDLDERGEHTVRYSQHLDWHFRQNRRDRDSARRAHSRHWHYDLSDWLQYEEVEDLDERGEHTVRYSQHLDWHFRQNRRDRDSARRAHSRHWHYDLSDWLQYEEVEDLDEREKSWFETGGAEEGGAAGAGGAGGAAEAAEEAPSVAAGAPADCACALCGDKFDQFYNEDKEEWHLRNSVRHLDNNYHPICFEDYKASLTKDEPKADESTVDTPLDKIEEAIEIKDVDEDLNSQSDNESVVEVVEPEPVIMSEPVEIDEGEEDDVIYKAEPVEQVEVADDEDTDDETSEVRRQRDQLAAIDLAKVKVKLEPLDPDDEPVITAEEETPATSADTTSAGVTSSIDGNLQLEGTAAPQPPPTRSIRINISKPLPTPDLPPSDLEDVSADDEPLPPGEEPELQYKLKPSMEGVRFSRQLPVQRGNELSGLCSIM